MARVLIVGCGCRGAALGRALPAHTIRGTSRSPARLLELETAGIEGVLVDPDRLATVVPALSGVTILCWLMGTASGSPELHRSRLHTLAEHLVDTPVRGLVYEAAGTVDPGLLEAGAELVRDTSRVWHIPVEVVSADPAEHEAWLRAMRGAVERLLAR